MRKSLLLITTLVVSATMGLPAFAAMITISTSDNPVRAGMDNQGFWTLAAANSNPINDNYHTGRNDFYRSYFTFDLAGVTGTVTGARVEVRRYTTTVGMVWNLWDVSTSASDLARRTIVDSALFEDLGTGTNYGSLTAGTGTHTDLFSVTLNMAALVDINAGLGGYFSIGNSAVGAGSVFSSSGAEPANSNGRFNSVQRLVLTTSPSIVPEPSVLGLFSLGFLSLLLSRRRSNTA